MGLFGHKGELKVTPYDSWPKEQELKKVYLKAKNHFEALKIMSSRRHNKFWLLTFEDTETKTLINQELWLGREKVNHLQSGEYYVQDLIGLKVFNHKGKQIGSLVDIMKIPGCHDVFVVKNDTNEYLFPAIKKFIVNIDTKGHKITVRTDKTYYE